MRQPVLTFLQTLLVFHGAIAQMANEPVSSKIILKNGHLNLVAGQALKLLQVFYTGISYRALWILAIRAFTKRSFKAYPKERQKIFFYYFVLFTRLIVPVLVEPQTIVRIARPIRC